MARVVPVGEELVHEVVKGEAAVLQDAGFAILGEDDVFGAESGG